MTQRRCSRFRLLYGTVIFFLGTVESLAFDPSLKGIVLDATTRGPVSFAYVVLRETGERTSTDETGRFRFEHLLAGRYTLSVQHVAYAAFERTITLGASDSVLVEMEPAILKSAEVVVRSTRVATAANTTPYPLDVELAENFKRTSKVTLSEALLDIPGVALIRDGSWETAVSIRGMGRSNIVAMVDGTRIETANDIAGALSLFNTHDLARVEILKSSSSTPHGTGALGGVVQMISKRPSFTDQSELGGELSSDISSVDGSVSQYLAVERSANRYAFRLSGGYRRGGNTMTPDGVLPNSQYRDFSLSGSLGVSTLAGQSLFLTYQRVQAEDTGIPGGAPFVSTASATYKLARRELLAMEYVMPNLAPNVPLVTFRISRQEISRNVEVVQSPVLTLTPHAVHTTTSFQGEAKFCLAPDLLFTTGVEAWQRQLDSRRERSNSVTNQLIGERPVPRSTYLSAGIYAQNEWSIVPERWTMTLGARYDWIRIANDEVKNPEYAIVSGSVQIPPPNQHLVWSGGSARDGSWSADAGLRYSLSSGMDITALASTAFRSPSLEERFEFIDLGTVVWVGNPNLQPERSICLNAALHIRAEGMRIRADAFLNHLTDLVAEASGTYENRPAFYKTNIGAARLYGFEIANEHMLVPRVAIKYSMAYVRGEDILNHANLAQMPPFNGRVELDGDVSPAGTLNLSMTWASTQGNTAENELRTAGYSVFDLGFVSRPVTEGGFEMTFRGAIRNCFNKAYRNHLSTLRGLIRDEPGRNFTLSITVAL